MPYDAPTLVILSLAFAIAGSITASLITIARRMNEACITLAEIEDRMHRAPRDD